MLKCIGKGFLTFTELKRINAFLSYSLSLKAVTAGLLSKADEEGVGTI